MGKGPTRILEMVDYGVKSRPLTDPGSLGLSLDLTRLDSKPGSTKPLHVLIEQIHDLTFDF